MCDITVIRLQIRPQEPALLVALLIHIQTHPGRKPAQEPKICKENLPARQVRFQIISTGLSPQTRHPRGLKRSGLAVCRQRRITFKRAVFRDYIAFPPKPTFQCGYSQSRPRPGPGGRPARCTAAVRAVAKRKVRQPPAGRNLDDFPARSPKHTFQCG
jgi:hypothetical protein